MAAKPLQISGAESRIMEALWRAGPLTVAELLADVVEPQGWSDATAKSLIGRLLKKGALRSQRIDGRVVYHPLVSKDHYVRSESQGLLDRLFGGELAPLVNHFAKDRALSPDDQAQLQALLKKIDRDG